jgi:predicted kinase
MSVTFQPYHPDTWTTGYFNSWAVDGWGHGADLLMNQATLEDVVRAYPKPAKLETKPVERKPRLYFTIGAARSGKSTYAKRWVQGLEDIEGWDGFPRVRWNQDCMRLNVHGQRYAKEAEPFIHTMKSYAVKTLLDGGHDVIVDGTNTTEASIRQLLDIDLDARYILIDTKLHVCLQRALDTGQGDLIPVIRRHCRQIEVLQLEGIPNVVRRVRSEIEEYRSERWAS